MNDLISRQAAIEAFEESYLYYDEYDDARVHNALDAVFEKIKELPSAQPEQECEKCIFKPFKNFPYKGGE